MKLNNVNGCNNISFGDHSILEGDRIPPLKSHGQALEEELCFPGVRSDNSDAPSSLLQMYWLEVLYREASAGACATHIEAYDDELFSNVKTEDAVQCIT